MMQYTCTAIKDSPTNAFCIAVKKGETYSVSKTEKGYVGVIVTGKFFNADGDTEQITRLQSKDWCKQYLKIDA